MSNMQNFQKNQRCKVKKKKYIFKILLRVVVGVVEEVAKMIFYGISGIDINGSPIARDK
jgi:hypothetical protein